MSSKPKPTPADTKSTTKTKKPKKEEPVVEYTADDADVAVEDANVDDANVDDAEAEDVSPEEEPEANAETSKKGVKKLPTKPKVGAKGSKNAKDPKSQAAEKKRKEEEEERLSLAYDMIASDLSLVTVFPNIVNAKFQDHLANAVYMHVLASINEIQQTEVKTEGDYNPYPSSKFVLLADKQNVGKKKAAVKSVEGKKAVPTKKVAPIKRGKQKKEDVVEETTEEPTEEPTAEVVNDTDVPDDSNVETTESKEAVESKKATIATFSKGGKCYLTFAVQRFTDDLYHPDAKDVKNSDKFIEFVYKVVSKDTSSHVSRSVVASVTRLRNLVSSIPNHPVTEEYVNNLKDAFKGKMGLLKFAAEYLGEYLKLIGYVLAQQLWVSRKGITEQSIESAIRVLDFGNNLFYLENKYSSSEESDYGLSCGFYRDAHVYNNILLPKKPPAKRKPADGATKGKKGARAGSKKKGAAEDEATDETNEADTNEEETPDEETNEETNEEETPEADTNEEEETPAKTSKSAKQPAKKAEVTKKTGLRKLG